MCARTTAQIRAGSELYGFYGYKRSGFPDDFPWYFELMEKLEEEEEEMKEKKKKGNSP
jgi:hypothetical protein